MIFSSTWRLCWIFLTWLPKTTISFSSGAPRSDCSVSQAPRHGFSAQQSPPPAVILLDQQAVLHRDYVRVTIKSSQAFKGYLVSAVGEGRRVGSWYIPYGDGSSQYLHCEGLQDSVTHTAHSSKRFVLSLQWKPPQSFSGNVTVLATLVMDYQTYWTNVTSDVITVLPEEYRDITEIVDMKVYSGQYDFGDYDYFQEDNSLMESVISTQMLVDFQKRSTEGEDEPEERRSTSKEKSQAPETPGAAEARIETTYKSVLLWPKQERTTTEETREVTRRAIESVRQTTQSQERQFEAWWRLPVTISPSQGTDNFYRPTFFADRAAQVISTTTFRSILMQPRKDSQSTKNKQKYPDRSVIPSIESIVEPQGQKVNIPILISNNKESKDTTEDEQYQNLIPFFSNIDQNTLETNTVQSVTESFSKLNRLIVTPSNQNDKRKSTYKYSNIQEIDAVFNDKNKPYTKMNAEHGSWDNGSADRQRTTVIILSSVLFTIYYRLYCQ